MQPDVQESNPTYKHTLYVDLAQDSLLAVIDIFPIGSKCNACYDAVFNIHNLLEPYKIHDIVSPTKEKLMQMFHIDAREVV